jgi:hypothetical protein
MNIVMYVSLFVCFFSLLLASIAIARVAKFTKSVHGLDWEAVATVLGDVATVKRSITRLNGRLNGMDNAQPTDFDWKQQAARVLSEPKQENQLRGG